MNRFIWTACALALLITAGRAQGQNTLSTNETSVSEFRQALLDLGTYLDAHTNSGSDLRRRFEAVPYDLLEAIYPHVANPRQLENAVAALKQDDAMHAAQRATAATPLAQPQAAAYPACSANTIIDTAPGTACTPAYPDPTNGAWQNLVNPLITFGAFSPSDYASVSSQSCSLTVASNLSQASSGLQGTVLAASAVCGIVPQPATAGCWALDAVFTLAAATSFGLFADCQSQGGNVTGAEVDAAFHNTVTIYNKVNAIDADIDTQIVNASAGIGTQITNVSAGIGTLITKANTDIDNNITTLQKAVTALQASMTANQAFNLQIAIETELLEAGTGGLGTFELPEAYGGYLGLTRTIVVNTIQNFQAAGQSVGSALTSLAQGDAARNNNDYKSAFTYYRNAYRLTVQ